MIATLTSQLTTWIASHGVYAVFLLMALDALVVPLGGELVMLYAGVLAGGAIAGAHATFLGAHPATGIESYLVLALAGTLGSLAGALIGWAIGARGGRPLIESHGRALHLGPRRFARAEEWFDRYGGRAVFLGRLTPLVRSFISIPAGVLRVPLGIYVVLSLLASAIWCFGFAAAGWAAGGTWTTIHHDFRYADYAAAAAVLVVGAALILRRRRALASVKA
jgi:membrane protein DedA with SNARE-associated domain